MIKISRSRFLPLRHHTAILRQIQHHLGLQSAIEHLIPTTAEPHAPLEPTTEDAETSAWAISLPTSSSPSLIIYILYFMYFLFEFPFFWYYILGLVVLLVFHIKLYCHQVIQISIMCEHTYHYIILILLLTTFYCFLKHVVSPIRLRLHVTQEVPLPSYFSIAFVTLRTMFSLVGGRVEEVSINPKP